MKILNTGVPRSKRLLSAISELAPVKVFMPKKLDDVKMYNSKPEIEALLKSMTQQQTLLIRVPKGFPTTDISSLKTQFTALGIADKQVAAHFQKELSGRYTYLAIEK